MDVLRYDFDVVSADGSDNLTQTILNILNDYPRLSEVAVSRIEFQLLDTVKGIAMFPSPNVAILTESKDVTNHVTQTCAYAFTVVYRTRANSDRIMNIKEWLDDLGRWIERIEYPPLAGEKEFLNISRTSQGYLYGTTEDKAEDWAISILATYRNEFDK